MRIKLNSLNPVIDSDLKNLIEEKYWVQRLNRRYPYKYGDQHKSFKNRVLRAILGCKKEIIGAFDTHQTCIGVMKMHMFLCWLCEKRSENP